jgi:hypothetical protein
MSGVDTRTLVTSAVLVVLIVAGLYILDPSLGGLLKKREGFEATMGSEANYTEEVGTNEIPGEVKRRQNTQQPFVASQQDQAAPPPSEAQVPTNVQGFADLSTMEGPASFGDAQAPAGCYPRDQLTPSELLPRDPNSVWAQQNPMGSGSLKGKNFLSAGALIGINTVGQSLRNANWQIRSEPPNPQVPVSVFYQSTIEPDVNRRTLEIN